MNSRARVTSHRGKLLIDLGSNSSPSTLRCTLWHSLDDDYFDKGPVIDWLIWTLPYKHRVDERISEIWINNALRIITRQLFERNLNIKCLFRLWSCGRVRNGRQWRSQSFDMKTHPAIQYSNGQIEQEHCFGAFVIGQMVPLSDFQSRRLQSLINRTKIES